jgi:AraC family transcriptional regulator
MYLRTETIPEMKIVGKRVAMSLVNNITGELFRSFMPRAQEIPNRANSELLCVQNYPEGYYKTFNPSTPFEKWAAAEVTSFEVIPEGMERAIIPSGLYAVFLFRGSNAQANDFFANIYMNWFPSSGFVVDHRPHFDVLGSKYKNNDPESEEEIWIPVRNKA